ncbi:hypothetical protein ILYODFUR_015559 [Ilyodon furcidens]|uniref:Uncharacterized protein n=1 Tax=Ilyodon furcidens TaxID=33524 RepID=A0ABV0SMA9_9TELE
MLQLSEWLKVLMKAIVVADVQLEISPDYQLSITDSGTIDLLSFKKKLEKVFLREVCFHLRHLKLSVFPACTPKVIKELDVFLFSSRNVTHLCSSGQFCAFKLIVECL